MTTAHHVLGVYSVLFNEIWLLIISIRKQKELLTNFAQAISDIHTVKKSAKTYIFTTRYKPFITGRKIDKEVVDDFFHGEKIGNKHFEASLLEKLLQNKKPVFELFCKRSLETRRKKKVLKPLSIVKEVCQAFGLLLIK